MYQITSYKFVMVILLKALVRWLCYLIGIWRWWTKNIEYKRSFSLKGIKKRKKMIRIFFHFLNYVEFAAFVLKIKKGVQFWNHKYNKKKWRNEGKFLKKILCMPQQIIFHSISSFMLFFYYGCVLCPES